MRNKFFFILFLSFLTFLVYHSAFFNFFAQDDFILLEKFSGDNLFADLLKSVTSYHETHWRPVHNLFFLITGNIFGKNFILYHVFLFILHIATSYLVFLVALKTIKTRSSAVVSSVVYAVHPFNFISLFWISGGATELAFMFFLISFICWLKNEFKYFLLFFVISLLTSESMIVGILIIFVWELLCGSISTRLKELKITLLATTLFAVLRFVFLTPKNTYDIYGVSISISSIIAIKYYLLRVLGFSETNGDLLISVFLIIWIFAFLAIFKRNINNLPYKYIVFFLCVLILGLLPFIAIPNHLSPHYMNISVWAFASMIGILLKGKARLYYFLIFVFFTISFIGTSVAQNNSWVITRAKLSKDYISQLEKENLPSGSTLIFDNNYLSSSLDAYYALGGGEGINFWFSNKNYKFCFSEFESCNALP